jgi:hypothetical protein
MMKRQCFALLENRSESKLHKAIVQVSANPRLFNQVDIDVRFTVDVVCAAMRDPSQWSIVPPVVQTVPFLRDVLTRVPSLVRVADFPPVVFKDERTQEAVRKLAISGKGTFDIYAAALPHFDALLSFTHSRDLLTKNLTNMDIVRRNGLCIYYLDVNDYDLCKAAVLQNGHAIFRIAMRLRTTEEFVLYALESTPCLIVHFSPKTPAMIQTCLKHGKLFVELARNSKYDTFDNLSVAVKSYPLAILSSKHNTFLNFCRLAPLMPNFDKFNLSRIRDFTRHAVSSTASFHTFLMFWENPNWKFGHRKNLVSARLLRSVFQFLGAPTFADYEIAKRAHNLLR